MSTPAALRRLLLGDLDSIVGKALAKERHHRYAAASDLAADLHRHQLLALASTLAPGGSDALRRRMVLEVLTVLRPWSGERPLEVADALAQLCELTSASGEESAAQGHALEVWELLRHQERLDRWDMAIIKVRAGRCLLRQGMLDEAKALLEPARRSLEQQVGAGHDDAEQARALLEELAVIRGRASFCRPSDHFPWWSSGGTSIPSLRNRSRAGSIRLSRRRSSSLGWGRPRASRSLLPSW